MKLWEIQKGSTSIEGLRRGERPNPRLGPNQVLIRVYATSLNYRDQAVVTGNYPGGAVQRDVIPLSDGAGEVVEVGPGVTRFKVGDRVAGTFFQTWTSGVPSASRPTLGYPLDGMLAEYAVLHEEGVVGIPRNLSYEEAATLPCAAVTAWNGLMVAGRQPVRPGDTVLCLGTGGVSMAALQFARAAGARVIVTSSSDDKIKRAQALGASDGVNYKTKPDWEKEVLALTNGRGVDHIVETGGAGTLARSYEAVAPGGKVAAIGILAGFVGDCNPVAIMFKNASLQGIGVGSREMFEDMNRAIEANNIKPVIDKVFPFDQAVEAYRYQRSEALFGKIVITV